MRVPKTDQRPKRTFGEMIGFGPRPAEANLPTPRIPVVNPVERPRDLLKPTGNFEARETLGDTLYWRGVKLYLKNDLLNAELAFLACKKHGGTSKTEADVDATIAKVRSEISAYKERGLAPIPEDEQIKTP